VLVFLALTVLLPSCLVNQLNISANDKLSPSTPTTRRVSLPNVSYGTDPLQKLDLYLPAASPIGIIIFFHSGGWCCGDKSEIDPLVLSQIDRGYAVASVNYRLVSGTTEEGQFADDVSRWEASSSGTGVTAEMQLADGDQAVRFVKAFWAWGYGGGKVIVSGRSSGGHIALLLAAAPGIFSGPGLGALAGVDPRVDGVFSNVGPSDLRPYIDGSVPGWGRGIAEAYLGCSNLGSVWPTTATTSTTTTSGVPSSSSTTNTTTLTPPVPMPRCDPNRVLRLSPIFWAALTVFLGISGHLPPAYLAYGDQDTLVPPASQGNALHDLWASGGNFYATYYDNPTQIGHNLSYEINATLFNHWLNLYAA
jgi:acetyl esterase/lipase